MCSSRVVPDRKCSILCQNSAVLDKFASDSRIVRKKIRSENGSKSRFYGSAQKSRLVVWSPKKSIELL